MTLPLSSVISAVRCSHSSCSKGLTSGWLKMRSRDKHFREFFRTDPRAPRRLARVLRELEEGTLRTSSRASIMGLKVFWFSSSVLAPALFSSENHHFRSVPAKVHSDWGHECTPSGGGAHRP